jgi:hypothetical protein
MGDVVFLFLLTLWSSKIDVGGGGGGGLNGMAGFKQIAPSTNKRAIAIKFIGQRGLCE